MHLLLPYCCSLAGEEAHSEEYHLPVQFRFYIYHTMAGSQTCGNNVLSMKTYWSKKGSNVTTSSPGCINASNAHSMPVYFLLISDHLNVIVTYRLTFIGT